MLTSKYGKPYADACRASVHPANVSEKLQHKMSIQAPPKLLVEKYLIEIAKIFNIDYEPDQSIMQSDHSRPDGFLIDLNDKNNLDGNIPAPPGPGFAQFPQPPPLPIMTHPPANIPFNYPGSQHNMPFNYPQLPQNIPFNYPGPSNNNNNNNGGGGMAAPFNQAFNNGPTAPYSYNYNIPPNPSPSSSQQPPQLPERKDLNVNFLDVSEGF